MPTKIKTKLAIISYIIFRPLCAYIQPDIKLEPECFNSAIMHIYKIPNMWIVKTPKKDALIILGKEYFFSSIFPVIIAAGIWGKLKTTFQMVAIGMLSFKITWLGINWFLIGTILMYAALVLSIYSAFVYYRDYFRNENKGEIA